MDLGAFSISLTVRDIEVLESSTRSLALQAPSRIPSAIPPRAG